MSLPDLYQTALTMVPGIGPVNAKSLLAYCGTAENIFHESRFVLSRIPGIGASTAQKIYQFSDFNRVEEEIRFIEKNNIRCLFFTDESYPYRLKQINDSPLMLYTRGNTDLNAKRILGVVGTRRPSSYGKDTCRSIINELKETGSLIISGLAYGVDIIAHRAALENGLHTGAVLAHGLDRLYPPAHHNTAREILYNGGSLITEFSSGTNPDAPNFPKRNRIVAGLCDAILVIESADQGGSLITADLAFQYNRDVMAIPGRINEPLSGGCNLLIKTNRASLVESARDIIENLNWDFQDIEINIQQTLPLDLTKDEKFVLEILNEGTQAIDSLTESVKMHPGKLSHILLELELRELIETLPGKKYRR